MDSTPETDIELSGQLPPEEQGILHSRKKCSLIPWQFSPSNSKLEVGGPWNEAREGISGFEAQVSFFAKLKYTARNAF